MADEERTAHWSSYSGLGKHRRCPQSWYYRSIRELEQIPGEDDAVEMWFGTWWHALRALDSLRRGEKLGTITLPPRSVDVPGDHVWDPEMPKGRISPTTSTEQFWDVVGQWWEQQAETTKEHWLKVLGEEPVARLRYVDEEWREHWGDQIEAEQPLAVEVRWRRALPAVPQPDGTRTDPNTTLVGYIDEVYFDRKRNLVVARDHKSTKQIPTQTALDDMLDSQLQIYAWGGAELIASFGRGPVRATAYDRVRSVKPKTPVLTKAGKLSVQTTDYDARTYREWAEAGQEYPGLKNDGSGAGVYQLNPEVLANYSTPQARAKWFDRTLTPLNRNVLVTHLRAAADTAVDQQLTRDRAAIEGQAARNLGSACRWCSYVKLCRTEMFGGSDGDYDLEEMGLRRKPVPKEPKVH